MKGIGCKLVFFSIAIAIILAFWSSKTCFCFLPNPAGMVAEGFLRDRIMELIGMETLASMGQMRGTQEINQTYKELKEKVDRYHRRKQQRLIEKYERKFEGKDVIHPDSKTKRMIDDYNREMDKIHSDWKNDLEKLQCQHKELLETYKKIWWEREKDAEGIWKWLFF